MLRLPLLPHEDMTAAQGCDPEVGETEIRTWSRDARAVLGRDDRPAAPARSGPHPELPPRRGSKSALPRDFCQVHLAYTDLYLLGRGGWPGKYLRRRIIVRRTQQSECRRAGHRPSPRPAGRTRLVEPTRLPPSRETMRTSPKPLFSVPSSPQAPGFVAPHSSALLASSPLRGPRSRVWNTVGPSAGVRHSRAPSFGFSATCSPDLAARPLLSPSLPLIPPS